MPTDAAFRQWTYLMLGLACAALGYAERDFLPEVTVLAAVVIVALIVLAAAGGRFELSLTAANRVGVVIAVVAAGWLAYLFASPNSLLNTFPWPASLLPCLGAVLLVLIPAKLSRPKHVGDWWAMEGIGLVTTGLASAMAEDEVFGVLLALYFVAFVTSLTLFYYRRAAGTLPAVPNTDAGPPAAVVAGPAGGRGGWSPRGLVGRAVGWLLAAVAVSLPVFFVTPRSEAPRWQFGRAFRETGFGADQLVDLNRTGELRVNHEVAYEVRAETAAGEPIDGLPADRRWRGVGYQNYENGRWTRYTIGTLLLRPASPARPPAAGQPPGESPPVPYLGPDQFRLTFTPLMRAAEPVLADPVDWRVGEPAPVWSVVNGEARPWLQLPDGSFQPPASRKERPPVHVQVARNPPGTANDPDLGPPFELVAKFEDVETTPVVLVSTFTAVKLRGVREFAVALLKRLAASDPALQAAFDRADVRKTFHLASADFERVARAVSAYFAESGEYTYSMTVRRQDRAIDPVEDFLLNTKSGHCERFAAGLALVLRALGVPAVYVLGYRGCDAAGDGTYLIRQEHAHAWVEVMVPRPPPPGFPFVDRGPLDARPTEVWHWLSLDPNPVAGDAQVQANDDDWLHDVRATWATFFADFIIGYNPERRQKAVAGAGHWFDQWWWAVVLVPPAAVAAVVGFRPVRRWRRRRTAGGLTGSGSPWFDQLARLLAAHGLGATPGATWQEAAAAAAATLRRWPDTAAVADVPVAVTRAFYLARYAGRSPTPGELAVLTGAIERLRAALRAMPRPS